MMLVLNVTKEQTHKHYEQYMSVRGRERHGLLIDPGAATGLIGSDTLKAYIDNVLKPLGRENDVVFTSSTSLLTGIDGVPKPAVAKVTMPSA